MPTLTTGQPGDVQVNVVPEDLDVYPDPALPSGYATLESDAQRGGQFHTSYGIRTTYRTRSGLEVMPSAGSFPTSSTLSTTVPSGLPLSGVAPAPFPAGPANPVNNYYGFAPAQAVRLHQPVTRKWVRWTAERYGAKPVLPHWEPQLAVNGQPQLNQDGSPAANANEVLRHMTWRGFAPVVTADGTDALWRAEGLYVYGLLYPVLDGDSFWTGALPTNTAPADLTTVDSWTFDRSILRSLPPQSAVVQGATLQAVKPQG